MANLLSWGKQKLQQVENGVSNTIVKPVTSFATPIVKTAEQLGQGAYHIAALPVETARTATAEITNNRAATNAGIQRGMQGINAIKGLGQGTADMAYQLGESINPTGGNVYNREHTFTNPVAKAVFGSAPIPSMQKQYKDTAAQHGGAYAKGEALTTALMDAAGARGAAEKVPGVKTAAEKTVPVVKAGAKVANSVHISGKSKLAQNAGIDEQIAQRSNAIRSLQERQKQTPIGSVASENHQRQIDMHQAAINTLKVAKQKLSVPEKLMNQQVGNTVGGPNALKYQLAQKQGKVFKGVDGKPRFEINDSGSAIKNPKGKTVGEVLGHPELYQNYPQLADIPVVADRKLGKETSAQFDGTGIRLNPDNFHNTREVKNKLLHELQHAIQDHESFAKGGSPETFMAQDHARILDQMNNTNDRLKRLQSGKGVSRVLAPLQRPRLEKKFSRLVADSNNIDSGVKSNEHLDKYHRLAGEAEARAVESRAYMSSGYRDTKPFYDSLDVPKDQLIIKHDGGTAMSTATLTLRKQLKDVAKQAQKEKDPVKKDALYQQVDKLIGTIGNADFEEALRRNGPMMSIDKPIAPVKSTKPAEAPLAPSAEPQLPASTETGGGSSPKGTPKNNNSLTLGAKADRQNLSPETVKLTKGSHIVRNTQALADISAASVDKLPVSTAIEQAHSMMDVPAGMVSDSQTGFIAKAIEKADTEATKARIAGNTIEADRLTRESADLHNKLSEHAVARGQASQALTIMYNKSPQGLFYGALKDLKKAGVADTPELRGRLQPLIDAVKTAKNPADKTDALANFHQAVSKEMPQHLSDKAIGIWKAGLLSGVKTQQGNAFSNATFGVLKKVSDVPATAVDRLMSVFTGKRTKTLTGSGIGSGTVEGTKNGIHTMKTGIDRRGAGDKYEQHAEIDFKHPILNNTLGTAVRTVFRGMNAADQPFWYAAFKNSMYDQAKAAGVTKGLKGSGLTKFMDDTVKNPTDQMANTALSEANKSTLNYDTLASKGIQAVHTGIDKVQSLNGRPVSPQARAIAHNAISVLAPFVRVPTAFLSRTIDFTPLGVGKEVFHQIATKTFDQRALSQAIGEGLTGTGAIALGISLTQHNMLSGDYPKNDPKEAQRWKAQGITPNSVKLGGTWVSLNYLGPLGLLFNAGNKLETAKGQGAANQAGQAIAGFGQGLMGQSFLQGFSGFSNAIQDPNRNLKSFVNSQAGSVVPNISNDVANLSDSMQRQANTPGQTVQSRIPGVRQNGIPGTPVKGLPTKQDVYGNPLKQPSGQLNTLIGVKPSTDLTSKNPVLDEVGRLHNVNPSDSNLQVTPSPVASKITVEGKQVQLNDTQRYNLQKQIGQATQTAWGKLMQTPQYKALDDTGKAKALSNLRTDVASATQRKYVIDNNLGTYSKAATAKQAAVINNTADLSNYTKGSTGSGVTVNPKTPAHSQKVLGVYNGLTADQRTKKSTTEKDWDYKVLQAQYDNNKASGKLSQAQDIKAQSALQKAKVGAGFDKTTRDLYSLSKDEVSNLITTDPNGQNIATNLLAYGDALAAATGNQNKFRTSKGAVSFTSAKKGSSTKSSLSAVLAAAKASHGPSKLTKVQTGSAPTTKSAAGKSAMKQVALRKYTVSKPKVNLNMLARLT